MCDTRSGFWMLVSIGVLSVMASRSVLGFAPDSDLTYQSFARASGFPMTVILPVVAILSVTCEWSQRSGLRWIDWNYTQVALFENGMDTATEWAMLASTTGIWIVLPLVVGLLLLPRSEVT